MNKTAIDQYKCPGTGMSHPYSFVNPNGYDFEWNTSNFFEVKERCTECGRERIAIYSFDHEREVDDNE